MDSGSVDVGSNPTGTMIMYCGNDNYYESWYCLVQAWKTELEKEEEIQTRKITKKWRNNVKTRS